MQSGRQGPGGRSGRPGSAHRDRAGAIQRARHRRGWCRACIAELRDARRGRDHIAQRDRFPARSKCRSRSPRWPTANVSTHWWPIGCIVRGETYHFELVANESGAGVTRVALDHRIPIANAILTVENEAQAWARADEKGRDAARVAVEMANLMEDLS